MELALSLAAALAAAPAVPSVGPAGPVPVPLVAFPDSSRPLAEWMAAEGWESKREDPGSWALEGGALHMAGKGDSVLIGTERGFPRAVSPGARLRVTLKVKTTPRGTDLAKKSGDDAALRVYVAFDKGGGLFSPQNTVAYAWTEREPAGTLIRSAHFANLNYVSIGHGPTPGADWVTLDCDLAADYKRAFPKDSALPRLKGLLIKSDSNDTKTSAEAWLKSVELVP